MVRRPVDTNSSEEFSGTRKISPVPDSYPRRRAPGSDWVYVKLFGGKFGADSLLVTKILPLACRAQVNGWAKRWFFIHFDKPDWHLRIRFHGEPKSLQENLLPALFTALEQDVSSGRVWRVQFDTYEREVERYGGVAGMELSEQIFHFDSEAVAALLHEFWDEVSVFKSEVRFYLALLGCDRLLDDLGYD
ncbi:MAG: thiopeptide-type bacteriocin biosynthesis protein, partial [Planctomycetota bacterium]|nr:thiopeptide-type bacteriocin biosynthesis protein [Planctomycetota bacterium]